MKKKLRKIKRRKGGKSNLYFDINTHNAIIKFQNTEEQDEREKIYIKEIEPSFNKLVENLIFIHGFSKPFGSHESLKNDCITFLYETLGKFDHTRGSKAFSYFNVVAKNWLIIRSIKQKKRVKRHVSADNPEGMTMLQREMYESHDVIPPPDELLINRNLRNEIQNLLSEIQGIVTSESEKSCISAVITVFKNIDELDFLNKRAILVYVREISGLSPKQLSVAMSSIRKHYRRLTGATGEFNLF